MIQKERHHTVVYIFPKYWVVSKIHWHTVWEICYKAIIKDSITYQSCSYTSLWNANVRKQRALYAGRLGNNLVERWNCQRPDVRQTRTVVTDSRHNDRWQISLIFDFGIDEYQAYLVQFWHADTRCLRLTERHSSAKKSICSNVFCLCYRGCVQVNRSVNFSVCLMWIDFCQWSKWI